MRNDVVIIGAGLGGLECGLTLAKAGMRVVVLEQGGKIGGCIQSYQRHGHTFDTGFHYVGGLCEGQSLHSAFRMLGLLRLPWVRLDDDADIVSIGDRRYPLPQGFDNYVCALSDYFPRQRAGIAKYVEVLRHCSLHQFDALHGVFNPDELTEMNACQYLNETLRDPLLVDVVSGPSLKMELRRSSLPLFTFAHVSGGYAESCWRLQGSGQLIADTLARGIREHGGVVVCRKRVEELVERDGRIVAALCGDGEEIEGDTFISDVHPSVTCGMVKNSAKIRHIYRRRMTRLANTTGMFTVSLVVKGGVLPYFNNNRYIYPHGDVWGAHEEHADVSCVMISGRGDGTWTTQVDLLTPMSIAECAQWTDTVVGHRGEEYKEMKRRKAGECIAIAERELPGLGGAVAECHTSTPLTWRDYTLAPDGTAYGIRKDCEDPLSTMLSIKTPLPNLLLTGQNVMLHGIHGVTMTALFTCASLLGADYIARQLSESEA